MRKFNRVVGVTFAIFALQSYAASIYDPGIQYCQSNPTLCGLEGYGSFERGKIETQQTCQQNPSSCGIVTTDTNGSTAEGISQCQRNPTSCGLEGSGSFESGKNQGIQQGTSQCQQNPSSCGIVTTDTNGSTAEGISQCQRNPSSCGIITTDTNGSTVEGISLCQQNPKSCNLEANGSFERGKVQGVQQGISQCQENPISCKIPLAFMETKARDLFPDDPEIFVYLSPQGFTGSKQSIFEMGMDSWYNYQLISRQRRTSNDPYVFDLKIVNGLQ